MDVFIVLAQVTSVIGWILLIYSYYKEDMDKLLFIQIISSIFYCASYLFLGAYSGFIVCFIELIKGIGYYKTDKDDYIFLASLPVYMVTGFFSYDQIYSLLPIIGSIIDGYSLSKSKNIATLGAIIGNILWVIYDIIILAYATALTDSILIISNISILLFGYSMILKSYKLRIVKCKTLSSNIYSVINQLDKNSYGNDYTWTISYEKEINEKSNGDMYLLKYHNDVIGYFNCICVNEKEYNRILVSDEIVKEYDLNNITRMYKSNKNYLIIDSINVKNKFQNQVTTKLIIKKIEEIIINYISKSYKIDGIIAIALNQFEASVLENIGFIKYKEYSKNAFMYSLDNTIIDALYSNSKKAKKKYKVIDKNISEDMLHSIYNLDSKFFSQEYMWDVEKQIEIFNKNPNSMIMVSYENKIIGYLNYLVISKEKYGAMIESSKTIDDFKINDIEKFYKRKKNYITLNSIVIMKKYQNSEVIKLLTKRFKRTLKELNNNNYKIAGVNAIAISDDGRKILNKIGFEQIKELKDGNTLFALENEALEKIL